MKLRVGVLTGGGDAPGLNAAICGLGRRLLPGGHELIGFRDGYRGLVEDEAQPISTMELVDLLTRGGSIVGCSSYNPYDHGSDAVDRLRATLASHRIDALVAIGGDGTLGATRRLHQEHDLPVVGVPKTIDNDVGGTDFTFGFFSAVETASRAMDDLRFTAESHSRVMVVECMGRHAGWITAYAGVASGAEAILVPERKAELRELFDRLEGLRRRGRRSAVLAVSEGTRLYLDGELLSSQERDRFGNYLTGGVAAQVAERIERYMKWSARAVVLGHLQRSGRPIAFDRIFALRLGAKAGTLVLENRFGRMAAMCNGEVSDVDLGEAVARIRQLSDHFLDRYENFFASSLDLSPGS